MVLWVGIDPRLRRTGVLWNEQGDQTKEKIYVQVTRHRYQRSLVKSKQICALQTTMLSSYSNSVRNSLSNPIFVRNWTLRQSSPIMNYSLRSNIYKDLELTILTLDKALDTIAWIGIPQILQVDQIATASRSRTVNRVAYNSSCPPQHSDDTTSTHVSSSHGAPIIELTHVRWNYPKSTWKRFNGDLTSWSAFWDSFESSIHLNLELCAIDKVQFTFDSWSYCWMSVCAYPSNW